jgi:RNA polymerase sigma-70 factor (ECF subfamily)
MSPPISEQPSVHPLGDAELLGAVAEGDQDALSELYDRFSSNLLALAGRILHDTADAEEVLQEVFSHVWNRADRYDPSRLSTWLVLITRSRAIDRLRSRKVSQRTTLALQRDKSHDHTSPEGAGNVLAHERRVRVREELEKLPPEQRQVLDLAFYGGMTQSEVARSTGIPLGTVKTRTLLAMKKLRRALDGEIRELL